MGGNEHGGLVFPEQFEDFLEKLSSRHHVEGRGRLVKDEEFGPLRQGQKESHLALGALGELGNLFLRFDSELGQQLICQGVVPVGVKRRTEIEELSDSHNRRQDLLLAEIPDPLPVLRSELEGISAQNRHAAGVRAKQAG